MSKEILYHLIEDYIAGRISDEEFSSSFERVYNFDTDDDDFTAVEQLVFKDLFDNAILFSPFEDDIRAFSEYVSGQRLRLAAERAREALRKN